ncbi:MAG: DUF1080 domain-containing protein [Puniceicoccales bacterium]|jgi:hypothetical protein|nr:DUF1080 domain-containing protein [Puniceicoccales bacterium]
MNSIFKTRTASVASVAIFALATVAFNQPAAAQCVHGKQNTGVKSPAQGWVPLWNGVDATGWRGAKIQSFPKKGWQMKNGELSVLKNGRGGDIITQKEYSDFELVLEFKLTAAANSGIKYFAQTGLAKNVGIGLEFQILDDQRHPDAKRGEKGTRTVGALYDLIAPPEDKPACGVGVWHTARIVSKNGKIEHWLNGVKVVEYNRHSDSFRARVAASKFKKIPKFGEWEKGHILLQDHNDHVSFRNIKIRDLSVNAPVGAQ